MNRIVVRNHKRWRQDLVIDAHTGALVESRTAKDSVGGFGRRQLFRRPVVVYKTVENQLVLQQGSKVIVLDPTDCKTRTRSYLGVLRTLLVRCGNTTITAREAALVRWFWSAVDPTYDTDWEGLADNFLGWLEETVTDSVRQEHLLQQWISGASEEAGAP